MSDKQRYKFLFHYRGDDPKNVAFATVAYSLNQAVLQIDKEKAGFMGKFNDDRLDWRIEKYIPKETPVAKPKDYKQLDFKGFALDKKWPTG